MVTKRYAHVVDEDRKKLAEAMERNIYGKGKKKDLNEDHSGDMETLMELAKSNCKALLARQLKPNTNSFVSAGGFVIVVPLYG